MDSQTEVAVSSLMERLMIMSFLSGLTTARPESDQNRASEHPVHDSTDRPPTGPPLDRIILINPLTQGMVVFRGSGTGFDSLLNDLMRKEGQPPASQASIQAMPTSEIKSEDEIESVGDECVICLDEWRVGDVAKEMPCKHKFHGECVDKWLKIHGSCPVCRHNMPVDDLDKKIGDGSGRRSRREIWVTLSFGDGRASEDSSNLVSDDSTSL